ncbi:MAG: chemotaxis response regulator protein-glutamate methylesterase [Pseudomonadota bacterium]
MPNNEPIRVLVVDDSVVYRKLISDILTELPDVEVVGTASNGKIALSKIAHRNPDVLTLDIEMPEMDGLELLERMKTAESDVGTIILSAFSRKDAQITLKALELGAFDFILKPEKSSRRENEEAVRDALIPKLRAFAAQKAMRRGSTREWSPSLAAAADQKCIGVRGDATQHKRPATRRESVKSEIVVIGVSTGGPNALALLISQLPSDLGVPILIVQHMPSIFTKSLANRLNSKCDMKVMEAVDGQPISPNVALIAPGGKQMKVASGDGKIIRVTDDPPENNCKPSVNYLFRSIAHHYGERATGVIMTGMGSDGTLGLRLMRRQGAMVIAQNADSCVVYGMPKEAIEAGIVDIIVPLDRIAMEICRTTGYTLRAVE